MDIILTGVEPKSSGYGFRRYKISVPSEAIFEITGESYSRTSPSNSQIVYLRDTQQSPFARGNAVIIRIAETIDEIKRAYPSIFSTFSSDMCGVAQQKPMSIIHKAATLAGIRLPRSTEWVSRPFARPLTRFDSMHQR